MPPTRGAPSRWRQSWYLSMRTTAGCFSGSKVPVVLIVDPPNRMNSRLSQTYSLRGAHVKFKAGSDSFLVYGTAFSESNVVGNVTLNPSTLLRINCAKDLLLNHHQSQRSLTVATYFVSVRGRRVGSDIHSYRSRATKRRSRCLATKSFLNLPARRLSPAAFLSVTSVPTSDCSARCRSRSIPMKRTCPLFATWSTRHEIRRASSSSRLCWIS